MHYHICPECHNEYADDCTGEHSLNKYCAPCYLNFNRLFRLEILKSVPSTRFGVASAGHLLALANYRK